MEPYRNDKRELADGRTYLTMKTTGLSVERIAEIAGTTQAEVQRLIDLVQAET